MMRIQDGGAPTRKAAARQEVEEKILEKPSGVQTRAKKFYNGVSSSLRGENKSAKTEDHQTGVDAKLSSTCVAAQELSHTWTVNPATFTVALALEL